MTRHSTLRGAPLGTGPAAEGPLQRSEIHAECAQALLLVHAPLCPSPPVPSSPPCPCSPGPPCRGCRGAWSRRGWAAACAGRGLAAPRPPLPAARPPRTAAAGAAAPPCGGHRDACFTEEPANGAGLHRALCPHQLPAPLPLQPAPTAACRAPPNHPSRQQLQGQHCPSHAAGLLSSAAHPSLGTAVRQLCLGTEVPCHLPRLCPS